MLLKITIVALLALMVSFMPTQKTFAMPELPEDIVQQLYSLGVIDKTKAPEKMSMLNMFWAFGLANKNAILESGPMMTYSQAGSPAEALAKAGGFASTGGWTLATGNAMDHYSHHELIKLTPEQQELVEKTSKNIFRPCCKNSTYFPDCNHGMAMLGVLELLASQGKTEKELYATAEAVNEVWFPPEPSQGCAT